MFIHFIYDTRVSVWSFAIQPGDFFVADEDMETHSVCDVGKPIVVVAGEADQFSASPQ